tara:strand:- start:6479 stop:6652 length:174 start_codon:yes stop_codon:yes gene_type:complete
LKNRIFLIEAGKEILDDSYKTLQGLIGMRYWNAIKKRVLLRRVGLKVGSVMLPLLVR